MPTTEEIRAAVEQRFAQVALQPGQEKKFPVGPASAKKLGYDPQEIDALPSSVTESFCGVGNPLGLGEVRPLEQTAAIVYSPGRFFGGGHPWLLQDLRSTPLTDFSSQSNTSSVFFSISVVRPRLDGRHELLDSAARPSLNLPLLLLLLMKGIGTTCTSTATRRAQNGTAGCALAACWPGGKGPFTADHSISGTNSP